MDDEDVFIHFIILVASFVLAFYSWKAVATDYANGMIDASRFAWAMILSLWILMPSSSRSK